jgi:membrane protease YdiL (CAAX protease family)
MKTLMTGRQLLWSAWVVGALLLLAVGQPLAYGIAVPLTALVLALIPGTLPRRTRPRSVGRQDLLVIGGLYLAVVGLYWLAFRFFTVDSVLGLFLCFAGGMLLGVVGSIVYTVWFRHRSMRTLGFRLDNWRQTALLGLVFAGVQFFLTIYGSNFPAPVDWVPLLVMSLTVGLFEAVFFRGFIQPRLTAMFGPVLGVAVAAALYALYHVGYGMNPAEMVFLFGLGVVYAVAFGVVRNLLVIWPLLTPLGGFFANLSSGGFDLPWMSILGFLDVLAVMVAAVVLAFRQERRRLHSAAHAISSGSN